MCGFDVHIMYIGNAYRNCTTIDEKYIGRIVYVERYGGLSSTKITNGGQYIRICVVRYVKRNAFEETNKL